jgi:hypothetical protein
MSDILSWLLTWILTVLGSAAVLILPLAIPMWRDTVGKYLAGLVQRRFDEQMERLRSDLRKTEESFRSDLRAKEHQIKSLSDTTLALRSSRQTALDARRLVAVERLWAAKAKLDTLKMSAKLMETIDFKKAARETTHDANARKLFSIFDRMDAFAKMASGTSVEPERPFLTPVVWAAFSAYQAVLMQAMVQIKFLATGVGKPELLNPGHQTS